VQGCIICEISFRDSVSSYTESYRGSSKHQHRKNDRENQDKLGGFQGNVRVNSKPVASLILISRSIMVYREWNVEFGMRDAEKRRWN